MTSTEPQVWAALGVLAAALLGGIGGLVVQINRTMTAQFAAQRAEFKGDIAEARAEFRGEVASVKGEFGVVLAEIRGDIQGLRNEISHLDRDVQTIARRVFGGESTD